MSTSLTLTCLSGCWTDSDGTQRLIIDTARSATKIIPEDLVPIKNIGVLELNRNVDNYFAETEQVAFWCASGMTCGPSSS